MENKMDYDEPNYYYANHDADDWVHIDQLDHARDHMQALLDILYGENTVDNFEDHLEEICLVLDIKLPLNSLTVRKA